MTKEEANLKLRELEKEYSAIEEKMVSLALEHNLYLNMGEYGSGKTLLLSDETYYGKSRGDWLYSSETC